MQIWLSLDDEETGEELQLVPGSHGMNVPTACTIVIIAGMNTTKKKDETRFSFLGEYLVKVDRVMTQVDRITEDIAHMPLAAFIFREKEGDEVQFSNDIRYN